MKIPLVMDRFKNDIAVALTTVGKKKAEDLTLNGPKYDIMSSLLENGTMTVEELSRENKMTTAKVRDILRALIHSGYVKKVSA